MDLDELIQSVSRTKILTTEEALNLILMVKDSKPRQKLCFSNRRRQGVWETRLYKGLQFDYPQLSGTRHIQVPFVVQNCNRGILMKSIFLLNVHSCTFEKITLQSTKGSIRTLKHVLHEGKILHEVIFDHPVSLQSNVQNLVSFQIAAKQNNPPATRLQGHNVIRHLQQTRMQGQGGVFGGLNFVQENKSSAPTASVFGVTLKAQPKENVTITMQSQSWYFVVGFKYSIKP